MNTILDTAVVEKFITRIHSLKPSAKPQWGKMTSSQMMAHCNIALETAMGKGLNKQHLMGKLMGWLAKRMLVSDKPWKPNMPTDKNFIISGEPNFNEQKEKLISQLRIFAALDASEFKNRVHPFFGKLTYEEWNILQRKHLDHHLRQFSV